MELGLQVPIQLLKVSGDKVFKSVGPLWFTYQFLDFLAARVGIGFPFEPSFEAKGLPLNIDILAKYKVMDALAIIGSLGFATPITFDKKYGSKALPILVGAQYTFVADFWGQLYTGYVYNLDNSDASAIPLALKLGYTIAGVPLDLGLNFEMANLAPKSGGAMDQKSLGIFATYLF
jgi:hypothetical protein